MSDKNQPIQRRKRAALAAMGAWWAWPTFPSGAQAYPSKSGRLMLPYAPAGGTDILARLFGIKQE